MQQVKGGYWHVNKLQNIWLEFKTVDKVKAKKEENPIVGKGGLGMSEEKKKKYYYYASEAVKAKKEEEKKEEKKE